MTRRPNAAVVTTPAPRPPGPVPAYLPWAAAGTLLALVVLLLDVRASGHGILRPIRAGSRGPGATLIARDFPGVTTPDEVGLDGQQFYAMARDPFHPKAVAPSLDRPRYRYQRPLYPMLAWVLHPSGGGGGLVLAMVAVSLVGLLIGGLALGALSDILRGPPWLAVLYPLLPGAMWALTSSVADALAVSFSLVTVVATLGRRRAVAMLAALAAVLTKETTILVPLGLLLARRRQDDLPVLVVPAVALAAWLVVVRVIVPDGGISEHLVVPLTGLVDALRSRWLHGKELVGMASTVPAVVMGLFVVARRRGPVELRWVIGVQLAFLSVCSGAVLGDDFGGTRATLMLLAVALAVLVSHAQLREPRGSPARSTYLPASTSARNLPV